MATGYDNAATLVRQKFETDWTALHPTYPIAFENVVFEESLDSNGDIIPWVRPVFQVADSFQIGIAPSNQNLWRHIGIYSISIFIPVGKGEGLSHELVDDVSGIIRGLNESGVQFKAPVMRTIGTRGNSHQVNVDTEFWFDLIA